MGVMLIMLVIGLPFKMLKQVTKSFFIRLTSKVEKSALNRIRVIIASALINRLTISVALNTPL